MEQHAIIVETTWKRIQLKNIKQSKMIIAFHDKYHVHTTNIITENSVF